MEKAYRLEDVEETIAEMELVEVPDVFIINGSSDKKKYFMV